MDSLSIGRLSRAVSKHEYADDHSHEEWDRRFVEWAESHNDLPKLAPEAFQSADFYLECASTV